MLSLNDLVLATIKRNAPSAYKEADFVKLLENKGIGRPSTYASYLPTLVKREYISISQDKKHIITPTHKGKRVVEVFENAYQFIIDLTYTKQMEEVLDEIVENKSSYVDFISNLNSKCPKIEKLERNDDEIKPSSEGQITYIENILRDLQLNLSEEFKNYKEDNRKPKPVNKPQDSFNVILAFDNDINGKGYKEKCEGILYALTQQFPTIYTPFSKDCNDDLKLAHIIENKAINIDTMAEFLESSLEKLKDNYTSTQEKENIMDKLEQIDSIKPFNERLKGILENAKENLQAQSCVKGRGR